MYFFLWQKKITACLYSRVTARCNMFYCRMSPQRSVIDKTFNLLMSVMCYFHFQTNAMTDILYTIHKNRDTVIALETDPENMEGHSITGGHSNMPLKLLHLIPKARKLWVRTFQIRKSTVTLTIVGKMNRWMGELTLVRGLTKICPSRMIGMNGMVTGEITMREETGQVHLILTVSSLKQLLQT